MGNRSRSKDDDFYAGIIAALGVVTLHDSEVMHREIVDLCDVRGLVGCARRNGDLEFAGFVKYGYVNRRGYLHRRKGSANGTG